ncbi:HEAT repeat domain-containing protein [Streptomyces odontomachi]|uniref:HEAT repeat domain-containing protein n=1 Tax=Streptomyces odontomachi TaxID=2944940 RepID=UPI00210BC084|nr:HEAT repeat domain-containing protein [Streptomyces sp. ODS25]
MTDFKERLVLKGPVNRTQVSDIAWDLDWDLHDIGDTRKEIYVDIWFDRTKSVEIHYVEDSYVALTYLTLRGEDVTQVSRDIRARLALWNPRQALVEVEQSTDRDARLRAVYAAALSSPSEDPAVIEAFRTIARTDEDPGVRQAVVLATGYTPWPDLVHLVAELRDSDPVDHVRHNAQVLLDGLSIHPPNSGDEA